MLYEYSWDRPMGLSEQTQTYTCPYCNKVVAGKIHHNISYESNFPNVGNIEEVVYSVMECPSCHQPTIYKRNDKTTNPFNKPLVPVNDVPEDINRIYEEVRTTIAAECYTSAVMLARTALMYIAVQKGAKTGEKFVFYVDYLNNNHYIPPNSRDWVDKIRKMGNDTAHQLTYWKKEDAELIGKLLMHLLRIIYELPNSI